MFNYSLYLLIVKKVLGLAFTYIEVIGLNAFHKLIILEKVPNLRNRCLIEIVKLSSTRFTFKNVLNTDVHWFMKKHDHRQVIQIELTCNEYKELDKRLTTSLEKYQYS